MLNLKNLRSPKGANKNTKRIGRGQGSGQGKQAGKGHKGQKARKSGHVRMGFEGGAMPLYIKLPKRGFKNYPFKKSFAEVGLKQILKFFPKVNDVVSRESLIEKGVLKGNRRSLPIKILAGASLDKSLVFDGISSFSETAKKEIEKSGSKIIERNKE